MDVKKCNVFKLNIVATDLDGAVKLVESRLEHLSGKYITFSNVHTTVMAADNEKYAHVQNNAEYIFADGVPIAWFQRKSGFQNARRVAGPDFMKAIFELSEEKGYRHFFYGSSEEVLASLEKELKAEYPTILMKAYAPPFEKKLDRDYSADIQMMNDFVPDFVWIGLGAPKQELWMYKNQNKINAPMFGVGAGFDFHAKTTKRAPLWMQNCGLEWLYRLFHNPAKYWGRYFYSNLRFLFLLLKTGR